MIPVALLVCASFLLALVGCGFMRSFALRRSLVDHPNERSLHAIPVPRLGGVAIVVASWLGVVGYLALSGSLSGSARGELVAWAGLSLGVALLGLVDDLRPLPSALRFLLQGAFAMLLVTLAPLPRPLPLISGFAVTLPPVVASTIAVVWVVGVLNIYNFMDGMDGLAGVQGIGASLSLGVVAVAHGQADFACLGFVLAAAVAGFLLHNAPPAKIFMGDAGSTYLGFTFAAVALLGMRRSDPIPFISLPIALAPFLLDGTFTILRRASRGEAVWRAHRSHLYQRAVGAGLGHHEVLVPYAAWVALSAAASVIASRASALASVGLVAAMGALLLVMWRWVVARERAQPLNPAN